MKRLFVFFVLAGCCISMQAQKVYDFNITCQQAYQEINKLKITNGLALIEKAKRENPDNLMPAFLESYADFYVLFLNEDPKDYQTLYPKFAEQLDLLEQGPKSSPFYNYCLSMVKVHQAASAIKFGKLWDGGWGFRKAYQLIKDNKKQFPNFAPNDLVYGALSSVVGTIPKGYKWIAGIFGMSGSLTEGMKTIKGFTTSNDAWARLFFSEAAFIYPYQ
jgi:hypothetical protein